MKFIIKLMVVLVVVLVAGIGDVQAQTRKYSNEFMKIGAGARGFAMGDAQTASVNDGSASYWNPAGLMEVDAPAQVYFMHGAMYAGIANLNFGTITFQSSDNSRIGIGLLRLGVDDIPNTFELIDNNGLVDYSRVTSFSVADYAAYISYSRQPQEKPWRYGINAKVIHRQGGDFGRAWGFGADVGGQYLINNQMRVGLLLRDITTTFNAWSYSFSDRQRQVLQQTNNRVPENTIEITLPQAELGFSYNKQWGRFSAGGELNGVFRFDGESYSVVSNKTFTLDPRMGIELGYNNLIFLRGGVSGFQRITTNNPNDFREYTAYEPTLGAGISLDVFQLDYAYSDLGDQAPMPYSHIFTVIFNIAEQSK